jgi:hypothetical protein
MGKKQKQTRKKRILVKPENKAKKRNHKKLEMRGIDPRASRMLSERSTI